MHRSTKQQVKPLRLARLLAAVGTTAALVFAAPAHATTLTFDSQPVVTYAGGESFNELGYNLLMLQGPLAAELGLNGGVGTVINNSNPLSCDITGCPSGATANYLFIANDGAVRIQSLVEGMRFGVTSLQYAFVSPSPVPSASYGLLQLDGVLFDGGGVLSTQLALPGQNASGQFMFGQSNFDPIFSAGLFRSMTISACIYDEEMACNNSLESPAFNQAQFAIDNVTLNEVPEPASMLLAGLGLGALGLTRRRRKAALSANA